MSSEETINNCNLKMKKAFAAFTNDLGSLRDILDKHKDHTIFIDLPKDRTKPPNNKYSMDEIKPILENYSNIRTDSE